MKKLAKYLKKYKKQVILGPCFKIIEAIFELIVPIVIASLIDNGINKLDKDYVIKMGLILLGLAIVGLSSTLVCQYYASVASTGFTKEIRLDLFKHINLLSHEELDKIGSSSLINRLNSDVNQLQTAVAMLIRLVIRAPFLVIGATIMAISINSKIAIIFLLTAIFISIILYLIMSRTLPFYKNIQKELDDVSLVTKENLSGARVVRAFSKEKDEEKRFKKETEDLKKASIRASLISSLLNPLTFIIVNGAIIAILYYGSIQINIGGLTQGNVIALIIYMNQILLALIVVANLVIIFTKAGAASSRINEIFNLETSVKDGNKNIEKINRIEFKNVSFQYNEHLDYTIKNVSFTLKDNESLGIIGIIGSGKSTIVNLIPRFYDTSEGKIFINEYDIKEYLIKDLRNCIGFVPQKSTLVRGTIRTNLVMGRKNINDKEIEKVLRIANVDEVVRNKDGGLNHEVQEWGKNFSGGQKQRLCIARALLNNPSVIILDDSTSALDYATDKSIRESLTEVNAMKIIVSQRTRTIMDCDKILVIKDGIVSGIGNHNELINECEDYQEIFYSQNEVQ